MGMVSPCGLLMPLDALGGDDGETHGFSTIAE